MNFDIIKFTEKETNIGHNFWMICDNAFIFHLYIFVVRGFLATKVNVIWQGQGQISRSPD